jgi:hypothetical protein
MKPEAHVKHLGDMTSLLFKYGAQKEGECQQQSPLPLKL